MKFGVVFPQTEIGNDPAAIRDYAQAAEALGYNHLLVFDHVLGANEASHPDLTGPYRHTHAFHEPFVLFGYLAGITQTLELVTGIIILPQRQTALVAKQAATVDVLSGGRLRFGIGTGWNPVEYEALGETFHDRGRRSEEQVELLRALWTEELVSFEGHWHKVTDAGLNPLPIQRPIPIWFGGHADAVLKRIARFGDGWFPLFEPDAKEAPGEIEKLHAYVRQAGRNPGEIGIEGFINIADRSSEWLAERAAEWQALGVSHVSVNTMNAGLASPDAHTDAIKRFKEAVGGA
jgi:probable F420-dependent oxidoreductase